MVPLAGSFADPHLCSLSLTLPPPLASLQGEGPRNRGSAIHGAGTVVVAMLHRVAEEWKWGRSRTHPLSSL